MPKIQQIKGHNDSSFQMDNIPRRDFSQFNNQSFSRTARKSINDSIVPIHEVSYNPQFSKSPLANVEIQRKAHIQPIQRYNEESVYYDFKPQVQQMQMPQQKTGWKTILLRIFIILLILGLIVGLYFLVDAILGHKFMNKSQQTQSSNQDFSSFSSVGVTPIYFDPISYDSMSTYSSQGQGISTAVKKDSISPKTFPSVLPSQQQQNQSSQLNKTQPSQNSNLSTKVQAQYQTFPQQSSFDPYQNSIPPLNVYENRPLWDSQTQ